MEIDTLHCPNCGVKNSIEFNYCIQCGHNLQNLKATKNRTTTQQSTEGQNSYNVSQETPPVTSTGVVMAAVIMITTSLLWISIGFVQALHADFFINSVFFQDEIAISAIWNIVFSFLSIGIAIGILKKEKWSYNAAIWTSVIGVFWYLYLCIEAESIVYFLFALASVSVMLLVYNNKIIFNLPINPMAQNIDDSTTPRAYNEAKSIGVKILTVVFLLVFIGCLLYAVIFH